MKVKFILEHLSKLDPEEEVACEWFTREDAEHWTNEKIDEEMWNYIIDEVTFDGDDIQYAINSFKEHREEELIENAGSISR